MYVSFYKNNRERFSKILIYEKYFKICIYIYMQGSMLYKNNYRAPTI